jgi:hypothetical protein
VGDSYENADEAFKVKIPAAVTDVAVQGSQDTEESYWSIFWLCLLTGLLAGVYSVCFSFGARNGEFLFKA